MLCPCCNAIFDKEAAKEIEKASPLQPRQVDRYGRKRNLVFDKKGISHKTHKNKTYVPPTNVTIGNGPCI